MEESQATTYRKGGDVVDQKSLKHLQLWTDSPSRRKWEI